MQGNKHKCYNFKVISLQHINKLQYFLICILWIERLKLKLDINKMGGKKMAAFEFGNYPHKSEQAAAVQNKHSEAMQSPEQIINESPELVLGESLGTFKHLRSEPILTFKIYDSCRQKKCLNHKELGPARCKTGKVIEVPCEAVSATIVDLHIQSADIVQKEKSQFKEGYWDITIRYNFCYKLIFVDINGEEMPPVSAVSIYTKRCSLFGSFGSEVSVTTDLMPTSGILGHEPFILVESRALELGANIKEVCHDKHAMVNQVFVSIGLFSIVKLFRMASLLVESHGFVIPPECVDPVPLDPCDFFEELDFPLDTFAPPQKREFFSGTSHNIPSKKIESTQEVEKHI